MPYIKVSPSALSSMSETLRNSSSKVGRIESDFSGVARKLDWDVRSASDIQRRMDRIIDALENHASMLGDMRSFIGEAKRKYEAAQKEDAKLQKKYLKAINKVSASAKTTELTEAEELERRKRIASIWNWVVVGACVVGSIAVAVGTGGAAIPLIAMSTAAGAATAATRNLTDQYVEDGFEDGIDGASLGKDVAIGTFTGLASGVMGMGVSSYVTSHISSNVLVNSMLHSTSAAQRIGTSVVIGSVSEISSGIVVRGTTEMIQTGDVEAAVEKATDIKQVILDGVIGGTGAGVQEFTSIKKAQSAADAAAQKYNTSQKSTPLADGERAGLVNLKETPNGGVDFSESDYILRNSAGEPIQVKIKATGSRAKDYAAAEAVLREQGIDVDFASMRTGSDKTHVWHHLDDYNAFTNETTLQFVEVNAHEAINNHAGSAKQFQMVHGYGYSKKAVDTSQYHGLDVAKYISPIREYSTEGIQTQQALEDEGK